MSTAANSKPTPPHRVRLRDLRCAVSGNLCGSDAWEPNRPCLCDYCREWVRRIRLIQDRRRLNVRTALDHGGKRGVSGQAWARSNRWMPAFLEALESSGNFSAACDLARVDPKTVRSRMAADVDFQADVEEARARHADNIEEQAKKLAFEGVPTYAQYMGKRGERLGRRRSETLAAIILKGVKPKYRENYIEEKESTGAMVAAKINAFLNSYADPPESLDSVLKEISPTDAEALRTILAHFAPQTFLEALASRPELLPVDSLPILPA
jgi:hypothetical protein